MNGFGELTGKLEIEEQGNAGDARLPVRDARARDRRTTPRCASPAAGPDDVIIPVVGECDDGDMADSRTVTAGDVERALERRSARRSTRATSARAPGWCCFEFPGGIGTASRRVGDHHVGVLLLCNFGEREDLDVLGTSLGPGAGPRRATEGSCITVCATDAPARPAPAAAAGAAPAAGAGAGRVLRVGGLGRDRARVRDRRGRRTSANGELNPYFLAAWEAAHEAVLNCLVAARPAERLDGTMQDAFPVERGPPSWPPNADERER